MHIGAQVPILEIISPIVHLLLHLTKATPCLCKTTNHKYFDK